MPDKTLPPQHQETQPGIESAMRPRPQAERDTHGCGKLAGKLALITGGDSGIGRAVAFAYAKEGADIAIVYLNEHGNARETREKIEASGR
ncbi:MAG: SDR family NAD(P)-dependent oxidoreductase, partial [Gammaproteobacteria bacterium]